MHKQRFLGLDIGDRRIGVAISDPFGNTAAGLESITRTTLDADVDIVAELSRRHNVVEIVIGLPQNTDDPDGEHALKVMAFGKKLARATGLPVIYEDERLGSVSAIRTLTLQGLESPRSKDLVDRQSAAIILQKYLDRSEPPPTA